MSLASRNPDSLFYYSGPDAKGIYDKLVNNLKYQVLQGNLIESPNQSPIETNNPESNTLVVDVYVKNKIDKGSRSIMIARLFNTVHVLSQNANPENRISMERANYNIMFPINDTRITELNLSIAFQEWVRMLPDEPHYQRQAAFDKYLSIMHPRMTAMHGQSTSISRSRTMSMRGTGSPWLYPNF